MPRPTTGEVTERPWADGKTVTYGARVRAYGRRHRLTFGTNRQGWSHTRANIELEDILQKVERGTWVPPGKRTSVKQSQRPRPDGRQPFGPFARKVVASKRAHGLDDDTVAGLEWRLGYLLGEFEHLEVDEFHALLDAAGQLDRLARRDHRVGRRAALATLGLAGFRISELCGLRCAQVDLARARFKLADSKTEKGIREVEMTLWERDELLSHREQRIRDGFPMASEDRFFGTHTGGPRDPNRFRDRILGRTVERANAKRKDRGLPPLPKITPHSLRRTWAMFAAQAGRDPHWISDQIGHTSAAFTLQIYQQTRHRRLDDRERQAIWELMRFADEPAECPLTRQITRGGPEGNGPMNGPMGSGEPERRLGMPSQES
jgi:hypothetical protein